MASLALILRHNLNCCDFSRLFFLRSEKLMQMVVERQEADHAMSWLSTLGGAFSALGEEFEHCVSCS